MLIQGSDGLFVSKLSKQMVLFDCNFVLEAFQTFSEDI